MLFKLRQACILLIGIVSLYAVASPDLSKQTQENNQKVTSVFQNFLKKVHELSTGSPVRTVQVSPHVSVSSVDLSQDKAELIKTFLEKEIKNTRAKNKEKIKQSSNPVFVKFFKKFALNNSNKARLAITRFMTTGVLSGFSVYITTPEAPAVLIGLVSGSVGGLFQYNNSHILDFLEHPFLVRQNNKIHPHFDRSWKSSELSHYIKSFWIGVLYLSSVTILVNFINETPLLTNQDIINILKIATLGSFFMGSTEKINIKIRAKDKTQLAQKLVYDIDNHSYLLKDVLFPLKDQIKSEYYFTEQDFRTLYEDLVNTSGESLIDKIFKNEKLTVKTKEQILALIIKKHIHRSDYINAYYKIRDYADFRTVLSTSTVSALGLVAIAHNYSPVFLGLNPIDLILITAGPALVAGYSYYQKAKSKTQFKPQETLDSSHKILGLGTRLYQKCRQAFGLF